MTTCNTCDMLTVARGEDVTLEVSVLLATGAPYDLTGAQIFFTARRSWKDATALIEKSTANAGGSDAEIVLLPQIGTTKGKFHIFIDSGDTAGLTNVQVDSSRSYVYDIWLVTVANKHKIVRKMQTFQITPNVTRF